MWALVIIFEKMKRTIRLTILSVCWILASLCSCKKPGCIGSGGAVITQQRDIAPFSEIEVEDNIDLILIQQDFEKIEVNGPENILPNISTEVKGGKLTIRNTAGCRWMRSADEKISINVFLKDINQITYSGSGDITNRDTLHLGNLGIFSEKGAGNVDLTVDASGIHLSILKENAGFTLRGRSQSCFAFANPRGVLDLSHLAVNNLSLLYAGLADIHVNASDRIEAIIRYKGNVFYHGDPVISHTEYFSSGRLIKAP